ncbi:MAG: emopamil-binding family protein [Leifsonia sp.]
MTTVNPGPAPVAPVAQASPATLPLHKRPVDIFFIFMFSLFIVTCIISDAIPTLGIPQTSTTTNLFAQWNYTYSSQYDPLYKSPPIWLRFITGTSAFVYLPFYVLLIVCLSKGYNWIQLYAVIYATMIISLTSIPIFGVEFFGDAAQRTPQPIIFLLYNGPYVLIPLLLLIRMRKPFPFTRTF